MKTEVGAAAALLVAGWLAAPAAAQPASPTPSGPRPATDSRAIGSTLTAEVIADLPDGANLFSVLETTQADLVADRFNSGGLNVGQPARIGGLLASWRQTRYRVGDIEIASPSDGAPLLFPETAFWRSLTVTTGAMAVDEEAPALSVTLEPARPPARWSGTALAVASGGGLVAGPPTGRAPPVARLREFAHGRVLVGGPLTRRAGLVAGGSWTRNETVAHRLVAGERGERDSAFAHAVVAPDPSRELGVLGWVQRLRAPQGGEGSARDLALHLQSSFERRDAGMPVWKVFGGVTGRTRTAGDGPGRIRFADRLVDGPVPTLMGFREGAESRWAAGHRAWPWRSHPRHAVAVGLDVEHARARGSSIGPEQIDERVDGLPARVWLVADPGVDSLRRSTRITGFVRDRFALSSRVAAETSVRIEAVRGRARGAAAGIAWTSVLPGAALHWDLGTPLDLALVTGYRRAARALTLDLLAFGDPAAPVADVFRWEAEAAASGPATGVASAPEGSGVASASIVAAGPLVARVGPGTGGDPAFSGIDPRLPRPITDEFTIGLESRPRPGVRLRLTGVARRESPHVGVVNIGVPLTSYTTFTVPDANVDLLGEADDHVLTIYDRRPESFGRDRYLLTRTEHAAGSMGAIVIGVEAATDRLFLLIGATAAASVGPGGNRGFRALENDLGVLGELDADPNAAAFARGRLFNDRAYTIKWTTVYRLPNGIRIGAIARYQDGQPFSRLVLAPSLAQGVDVVRAFANGRSRFAFTGTLDVRVQKALAIGRMRLDAIVDVYNLPGMRKEVEERVVTGDRFRETTAVQPPRAVHLGVRIAF